MMPTNKLYDHERGEEATKVAMGFGEARADGVGGRGMVEDEERRLWREWLRRIEGWRGRRGGKGGDRRCWRGGKSRGGSMEQGACMKKMEYKFSFLL
ncbi:hypothetical protein CsSME_00031207 [Camellia sinensis var. sinensis]